MAETARQIHRDCGRSLLLQSQIWPGDERRCGIRQDTQ